jgi:antitoxin ParD1/3/4
MNVSLTPTLEKFVEEKVNSGLYTSASEVIREALRLLQEQDQIRRIKLEELQRDIQAGLTSGPAHPLIMENIKAKARARRNPKSPTPK